MRVFNEIDVVDAAAAGACPTLVLHASARRARAVRGRPADRGPDSRARASCRSTARNHLLLETEPAWQRWLEELRAFLPAAPAARRRFAALTPRERDLVELIAQGRDNAQIAARLGLSEKTVRNHITSIFAKLEVENRAQAIVLARDAGFGEQAP